MQIARSLAQRLHQQEFDFESAGNFLRLLDRLQARGVRAMEACAWTRTAALRFCVSRLAVDLLRKATHSAELAEVVAQAADEIAELARAAVAGLIAGERTLALATLAREGERTLNARLLEIAQEICERQGADAEPVLRERILALRRDYCSNGTQAGLQSRTDASAGAQAAREVRTHAA